MKKLFFAAIISLACISCTNSVEEQHSWTKVIDDQMVTVNTASGVSYTDDTSVTIEITDIKIPVFNLKIDGVKFVPMMPDVNFFISGIQYKLYPSDDTNDPLYGSWVFNEASKVPTVGGVSREEYTLLNLKGNITDNGITMEFDVNFGGTIYHATFGSNDALQTWEAEFKAAAIVVMNSGEGSSTSEDELSLSFSQENLSKQIVDITFKDFRFVAMMPEITFTLFDVPYTLSEDGTQRLFNVATVVPIVGNAEYSQYTMSNFKGSVSKSHVNLDFDIASMNAHVSLADK